MQPVQEGLLILSLDINERKQSQERELEYSKGLEAMVHMTCHKVRGPVAQIMGMADLFSNHQYSEKDLVRMTAYMKKSAVELDQFTRELTLYIQDLEEKTRK
jgi:nitrogen-specific signal transduction histidine kinase